MLRRCLCRISSIGWASPVSGRSTPYSTAETGAHLFEGLLISACVEKFSSHMRSMAFHKSRSVYKYAMRASLLIVMCTIICACGPIQGRLNTIQYRAGGSCKQDIDMHINEMSTLSSRLSPSSASTEICLLASIKSFSSC